MRSAAGGPAWTGSAGHERWVFRVHLELRRHPGTFLSALADMVLPAGDRAARDLRELEGALAAR